MTLKLLRQHGPTCGACSYATLLSAFGISISESEAIKEVGTKLQGTDDYRIIGALRKRKIECGYAYLNIDFNSYQRWLYLNSLNRILYVTCHGRNKRTYLNGSFKRGRPSEEHHAIIIFEGMVYDSAHNEIVPLEAYVFKYNTEFNIKTMIMVDTPKFKKHTEDV